MTSGVHNETELNYAEEQCVAHGYDFGNYSSSSRATSNKKTGDRGVKAKKDIIINQEGNKIQENKD